MRRLLWPLAIFLGLLLVCVGATGWFGVRLYRQPGPLAATANVVVPHGNLDQVGLALEHAGVVRHPFAFRILATLTRPAGPLHSAEFSFPAQASIRDVLHVLRTARPVQHHLTLPEGLTVVQLQQLITKAEALTGATPAFEEGSLLPETYAYEWGMPRAAIVARAHAAMDRLVAQLWATRAPGLPLAEPRQMVILASMVERETARANERPRVAAVFVNRLRLGMKLQSDPTVIYGVTNGATTMDHPLSHADLDHDDAFNTYRIAALPAAPICSPGLAALQAAAHPAAVTDLYFVADGSGGHQFADTLEQHQRNVAHYRGLTAPIPPMPTPAPDKHNPKAGHHVRVK